MTGDAPELDTPGGTLVLTDIIADVADLLLDMTKGTDVIPRAALRYAWTKVATDLNRKRGVGTPKAARSVTGSRGNDSSHKLKNALSRLERVGAVRRIGETPTDSVAVLDRALLQAVVDRWDGPEG